MKAYLYIKLVIEKVLQLTDYEIVLTGDSAGGNICLGVLNWILMNKLQVPKGVLLCYPVCNVDMNVFSPSYLHTLHDYLLSFNMLNLCLRCYLGNDNNPLTDFMIR
jgi:acetyl esterase/lipase